jgi:thymidylate synthase (FAD)
MAYCARVSSPNQDKEEIAGLFKYCIKNGHWSIFELADMTVEIVTSRAIAQQILRHRSFSFQEFSQRYAKASMGFEVYEARRQDTKNRQNSIDDMSDVVKAWFRDAQQEIQDKSLELYEKALEMGIAKEQARFLLPLSTTTKLYMKGSIRSWIHYINLRSGNGTQKEHMDIAKCIQEIFSQQFPAIAQAVAGAN